MLEALMLETLMLEALLPKINYSCRHWSAEQRPFNCRFIYFSFARQIISIPACLLRLEIRMNLRQVCNLLINHSLVREVVESCHSSGYCVGKVLCFVFIFSFPICT